jgi:N-acetyl-anhydromuramyl-L-alanine amidase AmpD
VVKVEELPVTQEPIPHDATRRAQMADYAERHYGRHTSRLTPSIIVLHFTAGTGDPRGLFAANTPAPGPAGSAAEPPGTCAHFVVMQSGEIRQLAPLDVMCRHTIGLNDRAIGIEMEEPSSADNILARPAQRRAAVRLVRALQAEFSIATDRVIGHGTANADPAFHDLQGWRNDHTDWNQAQVDRFRALL